MQFIDSRPWFCYRGLTPHQFMPMLGVHNKNQPTTKIVKGSSLYLYLFALPHVYFHMVRRFNQAIAYDTVH